MPARSLQPTQQINNAKSAITAWINDLYHLALRANKPSNTEYRRAVQVILLGVLIMGFVGFFVKIISIPINNILIGGGD